MSVTMQEMINFHLTGKRSGEGDATGPGPDACPALLMPYRALSELRYDFPLLLIDDPANPAIADSLTGVFNRLLQGIAPRREGRRTFAARCSAAGNENTGTGNGRS